MATKIYTVLLEIEAGTIEDASNKVDDVINGTELNMLQITQKDD